MNWGRPRLRDQPTSRIAKQGSQRRRIAECPSWHQFIGAIAAFQARNQQIVTARSLKTSRIADSNAESEPASGRAVRKQPPSSKCPLHKCWAILAKVRPGLNAVEKFNRFLDDAVVDFSEGGCRYGYIPAAAIARPKNVQWRPVHTINECVPRCPKKLLYHEFPAVFNDHMQAHMHRQRRTED